jgi:hypothetical protein
VAGTGVQGEQIAQHEEFLPQRRVGMQVDRLGVFVPDGDLAAGGAVADGDAELAKVCYGEREVDGDVAVGRVWSGC